MDGPPPAVPATGRWSSSAPWWTPCVALSKSRTPWSSATRAPWTPPSPYRRREIIQEQGEQSAAVRPMRTKARGVLIDALRDAHRWLDELTTDSSHTIESIAAREKKTERSIRLTMSLAFLSPALVKAAIDGRLPRGFGVKRLMDLPMAWSDQWSALGLKVPAQA